MLPEVLARFGLEPPVLVGHSDGASIALLYAGAGHPVAGLVLIAPHVFVEDVTVSVDRRARDAFARTDLRDRLARHHDDVDAHVLGLERHLAVAGLPVVEHRGLPRRDHVPGARRPG